MILISFLDRPQVIKGITEIAEKKIDVLSALWKKLFEPEIGQEHMKMLLEHVDAFFTDIIVETKDRETAIQERIESKIKCTLEVSDLSQLLFPQICIRRN